MTAPLSGRARRARATAHRPYETCDRCRRLSHRNSTFVRPSAATHRAHVGPAARMSS